METIYINWLAVLLAGLWSLIIGSLWYGPLYGKTWMKLAKVSKEQTKKGGASQILIAVLLAIITAFVLAYVASLANTFYAVDSLSIALNTALWLWLGFSLTTIVTHDLFESRPRKLTFLTAGYQFFLIMGMGAIIGLFGGF